MNEPKNKTLSEEVKKIISEITYGAVEPQKITDETPLFFGDNAILDSLESVETVMKVEERYNIDISDHEIEENDRFGFFVAFLEKKRAEILQKPPFKPAAKQPSSNSAKILAQNKR